jgi:hypothetical protein
MKKPKHFILNWGTYPQDTLVLIGTPHREWLKVAKIYSKKKDLLSWVEQEAMSEDISPIFKTSKGMFIYSPDHSYSMLWLAEWDSEWVNYETLMHELHHAVHLMLGKKRGMADETEALAYQQEFLFRQARRKLDGCV